MVSWLPNEVTAKYENCGKADEIFMHHRCAVLVAGSDDCTKRIFAGSGFHIFFVFPDRQITNLCVSHVLIKNTSTNSSLERVQANILHGICLRTLKMIGKNVANIFN